MTRSEDGRRLDSQGALAKPRRMERIPWDQRLARKLVRPLAATPIRPNHITTLTLALTVAGAILLAQGDAVFANWGAGLFVLGRFLDHFDGELARLQGASSKFGYYYDYVAGAVSYAALYMGIGIGLSGTEFGAWALGFGIAGALCSLLSLLGNLAEDRETGSDETGEAVGYPALAGVELEDGMYLLAPATWLGWLEPFFYLAAIGAVVYALVACVKGARAWRRTSAG